MIRGRAAAIAVTLVASSAEAAVLTADNASRLCIGSYQGKQAVDPDVLAHFIANEAGAGTYLDGSNPAGLRDGSIQLKSMGGVRSEPVYAVLNAGPMTIPTDNRPFGPNVDLKVDKRAAAARDSIVKVMREELLFLTAAGSIKASPGITFRIERRIVVGGPTEIAEWANPEFLFSADPPLVIVCDADVETVPEPAVPPGQPAISSSSDSLADVVRLRGTAKDLTVNAKDLKSAKPASLTYQRDNQANVDTFGLNGVLGVRFGDSAGTYSLIPYIAYEKRSVTGGKGDVEKLSPGLLVGYRLERPGFALHGRLEASLIEDMENDSRQAKMRVYLDPAFALGKGRGVLFGSYLQAVGPLHWRPDLTIVGDASRVLERGSSVALAGADDYYGLGGELSLRAFLGLGQPISDVVLQLGVRHLELYGDINKGYARRWYGTLEYAPQNFPYIGIGVSFSKGENDDTLQEEEIYGLSFTVRY